MSFFSKKSKAKKVSKSDSPKTTKKSRGGSPKEDRSRAKSPSKSLFSSGEDRSRAKSQPFGPSGKTKSSYSKTKSHDPDLSLGFSKLSIKSMSGGSEEEFYDVALSEDEFHDASTELPWLARQASTLAPPRDEGVEEMSYSPKAYKKSKAPPAKKSAPSAVKTKSKVSKQAVSSDSDDASKEAEERAYSPKAYSKSATPPAPVMMKGGASKQGGAFSKAKVTKSSPVGLAGDGKQKPGMKKAAFSKAHKGDSVDLPPSYSKVKGAGLQDDNPTDAPPPSYTESVGALSPPAPPLPPPLGLHHVHAKGAYSSTHPATISTPPPAPPVKAPSFPPASKSAPNLGKSMKLMKGGGASSKSGIPPRPPPPPDVSDTSPGKEVPDVTPMVVDTGPPRYPTKKGSAKPPGGIATDLHFELVAEELSPTDLPALCRHLGITSTKMEQVQYDNRHLPFQEQVIAILQDWKKKAGRAVTLKALLQALASSGNVMAANTIEDKLRARGEAVPRTKSIDISDRVPPDINSLKASRDYYAIDKFNLTLSELKTTYKEKDRAPGAESDPAYKLKYFCPKCNQGYSNVTLLNLHVDECIEHAATRNEVKMQASKDAVEEMESYHDKHPSIISDSPSHVSIIDDDTIREIASHCQEGDWQELAYHLGYMDHAIKRVEEQQASKTAPEQAEIMLKNWRLRQKKRTDMVLKVTVALRRCKSKMHLIDLADRIEKRHQAAQLRAANMGIGGESYHDKHPTTIYTSTIDDDTIREIASQCQEGDWQELAYHLGFMEHAIKKFEVRHVSNTAREQAEFMLQDWRRRQKMRTDMVLKVTVAMRRCKSKMHLIDLADRIEKRHQAAQLRATNMGRGGDSPLLSATDLSSSLPTNFDDDTLYQFSSQLGRDWKKLAAHLGFTEKAIKRLESQQPIYSHQEKALYMLKEWMKQQGPDTDYIGCLCKALHKCGERHLSELVEWLRLQQVQKPRSGSMSKPDKPAKLPEGLLSPETPTTPTTGDVKKSVGSHIMISYQWDAQQQAMELKRQLFKAGYNVWMDVDKMGGDLLGSMADAVENAAVIIMCVSKKYKESNNCRGEASYAFELKKPIIPVIVEEGYRPDGWLGMVISMRLYYRMWNSEVMKEDLSALINDIGDNGRTYQHSVSFSSRATPSSIDSFQLKNKHKVYVYLCDPQTELLPYADVWVTMFLNTDLRVFQDDVCQHLLAAGGDPLKRTLSALFGTTQPPLKVGTVLQTSPGNLPCQAAYHIVFKAYAHSSGYIAELSSAFAECFYLAQRRGASSIAFSLFTEQQTFEFKNVLDTLVTKIMKESQENRKGTVRRVLLATQNATLSKKISSDMYRAVNLQSLEDESTLLCKTELANGSKVVIKLGNIIGTSTDAIIASMSPAYQRVGICGQIYSSGGRELQAAFDNYTKKEVHSPGTAFRLTNGNLPCGRVIYAVVAAADVPRKENRKKLLGKAIINSLKIAEKEKCSSVAVPLIGANYGHFGNDETAKIIVGSVIEYFKEHQSSSIKEVQFMDTNMFSCNSFRKELAAIVGTENVQDEGGDDNDGGTGGYGSKDDDDIFEQEIELEETPAEILARGPAAHQAYLEASREGTKAVYRTRLMLVGQERVGKTSLMKNLSGQRFDATESITDGVDASTLCQVSDSKGKPWKLQKSAIQDLAKYLQSQYTETLCTLMAQRLTELSERGDQQVDSADEQQEKEEILELLSQMKDLQLQSGDAPQDEADGATPADTQDDDGDDLEMDSAPLSEEDEETDEQGVAMETETDADVMQEEKPDAPVPEAILTKLKQVLRQKKLEQAADDAAKGVQEFQIWDFAGQDVYYTTHQVFLSNRALYMVVFDLRIDLNKPVKVEVFHNDKVQSRFHDFTGLGFLDFWMQSIYAYATSNQSEPSEDKPQLSPPIFIIGTHRESEDISKDPVERKNKVSDKFQSISDMIAGKPYEQHVVSRYFAIENSSNDQEDSELTELRNQIASIASQEQYMGEKVPLRWLTFEKSVAEAITKNQHYMNLQQVRELTTELGVADDRELFTMLHFYHDLGTIIFFGGENNSNRYLQDMVILNPQWLIDIFKRIITVMPHQKQWATQKNKWRRLKEEGIIEDSLIDHMWNDLLPQKPALLALMEMFDLLCPRLEEDEDTQTYYVPACLQPCSEEDVKQELEASGKPVTFYVDFKGFLPDGLFHRLLVHAARWAQQQSGEEPQLYFRYGSFTLDEEHNFQLEMKGADPICIKVTICRVLCISPDGVQDNSNSEEQPCPKACSMVRTFLTHTLRELTFTWIRGIQYELTVACPCNELQCQSLESDPSKPKCFHLLQLEDCLSKAKIKCMGKKMWVATDIFKKWFHKKAEEDDQEDEIEKIKKANKTLSDVELFELGGEVGTSWKKLGLYLGLRAHHIATLNCDHPLTEDKAFNMLIQWHEGLSQDDDGRAKLSKALKKCGLVSLAECYETPKDVQ